MSAAWFKHLSCLCQQLSSLPLGPLEPTMLRVARAPEDVDIAELLNPRAATAKDVTLVLPFFARPGRDLLLKLVLSDCFTDTSPAELKATVDMLAFHTQVIVSQQCGAHMQPLTAITSSKRRGVLVSVTAPPATVFAAGDTNIDVISVTVAGQPVLGGVELPAVMPVVAGVTTPLRLRLANSSFIVTPSITHRDYSTLVLPQLEGSGQHEVLVFAANGAPLPSLDPASFGLSAGVVCAACSEPEQGTGRGRVSGRRQRR
jgi:hypothetical protein